jgi:hypothetical protein
MLLILAELRLPLVDRVEDGVKDAEEDEALEAAVEVRLGGGGCVDDSVDSSAFRFLGGVVTAAGD